MSYIEFKAHVKKVNLKPKGVKEIVLEVSDAGLDGKLDSLSEMIDQRVEISLESLVVNYNVTVDVNTNEPLTQYKVDQTGMVQEVEKTVEQLEADLGLPKEKIKTKDEAKEVDREVVDEFILKGLAPSYDDLPNDFAQIVKRRMEGESFIKLANELDKSSGVVAAMIDDFRQRVAPLAKAWSDWKEENPATEDDSNKDDSNIDDEGQVQGEPERDDAAIEVEKNNDELE